MGKTENECWHAMNGWGVQIQTKGPKGYYWRHATDRVQYYSEKMAQCFVDGLKSAEFDRPYRLVTPKNVTVRKYGPPAEK